MLDNGLPTQPAAHANRLAVKLLAVKGEPVASVAWGWASAVCYSLPRRVVFHTSMPTQPAADANRLAIKLLAVNLLAVKGEPVASAAWL